MSTIIKKNGDLTIENLYKLEMGMILICGVTHSGKNYILDRLAQTMILSGVYRIYVFSGTHDINMHGYSFTNYCYPIDYKHIKRIFDRQKYLKSLYEKGEISECRPITIILDDFVGGPFKLSEKDSQIIGRMATSGRHIKCNLVCLSQLVTAVPPVIRNQAQSGMFIITKLGRGAIESLYDYQSQFEKPDEFYKAYKDNVCNQEYSFMIISGNQYREHVHFCHPVERIDEFIYPRKNKRDNDYEGMIDEGLSESNNCESYDSKTSDD